VKLTMTRSSILRVLDGTSEKAGKGSESSSS
jgi:hypothetical protein